MSCSAAGYFGLFILKILNSLFLSHLPFRHLDAFEFYRAEDEREWARRYEEVHVDTKSASAMFKLLQAKLQYSAAYPHFLSLLHHLLLLPSESSLQYSSHSSLLLFLGILACADSRPSMYTNFPNLSKIPTLSMKVDVTCDCQQVRWLRLMPGSFMTEWCSSWSHSGQMVRTEKCRSWTSMSRRSSNCKSRVPNMSRRFIMNTSGNTILKHSTGYTSIDIYSEN